MKLILAVALGTCALFAQSKADWANVRSLPAGQEVQTLMQDGKSYRGQLQSVKDDSLIMIAASSQETLDRPQIKKISIRSNSHRLRNTMIGLGIGAGAGLTTGAIIDAAPCNGWCWPGKNYGKAIFTPLGALIGTVVGVAWPTGRWHDVYRP